MTMPPRYGLLVGRQRLRLSHRPLQATPHRQNGPPRHRRSKCSVDRPDRNTDLRMLHQRLHRILEERLSWREREILKMRFGLGDGHEYTLTEVSQVFNVSRERVRQIESRALKTLIEGQSNAELIGFVD